MASHILVVDDEPDLLELVRFNLERAGFSVETAASGCEALERLRRAPPDLMLLDVMLPDVSGSEICRQVRADAGLAQLPVILLTARADEADRAIGLGLGADDYVTKPFSPGDLTLRVRAVLSQRRARGARARRRLPIHRTSGLRSGAGGS